LIQNSIRLNPYDCQQDQNRQTTKLTPLVVALVAPVVALVALDAEFPKNNQKWLPVMTVQNTVHVRKSVKIQ